MLELSFFYCACVCTWTRSSINVLSGNLIFKKKKKKLVYYFTSPRFQSAEQKYLLWVSDATSSSIVSHSIQHTLSGILETCNTRAVTVKPIYNLQPLKGTQLVTWCKVNATTQQLPISQPLAALSTTKNTTPEFISPSFFLSLWSTDPHKRFWSEPRATTKGGSTAMCGGARAHLADGQHKQELTPRGTTGHFSILSQFNSF